MSNEPISSNESFKYLNRKGLTLLYPSSILYAMLVLLTPLFIFIFKYISPIIDSDTDSKTSFFLEYRGGEAFLFLLLLGSMIGLCSSFIGLVGLIFTDSILEFYFLEDSLLHKGRGFFVNKNERSFEIEYSRIENTSSWVGKKIILDIRKSNGEIDKQVFRVLNQVDFSLQYLFHTKVLRGKLQFEPGELGVKIGRGGTGMFWSLALVLCIASCLFYLCFSNLSYDRSGIQLLLVVLVIWLPLFIVIALFSVVKELITNRKSALYYLPSDSALVFSDFVNGQDFYTKIYLSHVISFDFNTGKKLELVYVHWDDTLKETKKTVDFLFSEKLSKETIQFLELMISEEEGGSGKIGPKAWDAYWIKKERLGS